MISNKINSIRGQEIPKKIHVSWKNKDILSYNYSIINQGLRNLQKLNSEWELVVYDDEDINKLLRDSIGEDNWQLIKNKKITEKTDLWRLLKVYKEGGLYIDIDRYVDIPLSEIIKKDTSMVLPTFLDIDFSQDFILTCKNNPVLGEAILSNLEFRKNKMPLFDTAVDSYMRSISRVISGKALPRGNNNKEYFKQIRKDIEICSFIETYREEGPGNHILFRNINGDFDQDIFARDKAELYNGQGVINWNIDTLGQHNSLKKDVKKKKINFIWQGLKGGETCLEREWINTLFQDFTINNISDEDYSCVLGNSIVIYSDMFSAKKEDYPESLHKTHDFIKKRQREYFKKFKKIKNCYLFHVSDEYGHAEVSHYKYFKHVFRNYYRKDCEGENVSFVPLGSNIKDVDEKKYSKKSFSIILPTCWKSPKNLVKTLCLLERVECIDEIIIVNNHFNSTPKYISEFKKLTVLTPGESLFLNESINMAVPQARNENIAILNDECFIDVSVFDYLGGAMEENRSLFFVNENCINFKSDENNNFYENFVKEKGDKIVDSIATCGRMLFCALKKHDFAPISKSVRHNFGDVSLFNNFQISGGKSRELTGFELTVFDCEERNESERLLDAKLNDWLVYKNAKKN